MLEILSELENKIIYNDNIVKHEILLVIEFSTHNESIDQDINNELIGYNDKYNTLYGNIKNNNKIKMYNAERMKEIEKILIEIYIKNKWYEELYMKFYEWIFNYQIQPVTRNGNTIFENIPSYNQTTDIISTYRYNMPRPFATMALFLFIHRTYRFFIIKNITSNYQKGYLNILSPFLRTPIEFGLNFYEQWIIFIMEEYLKKR